MGISDSFGAALWGLDYAMQMAFANFSASLFHVGGQSVFYNPFTRTPIFIFIFIFIFFGGANYVFLSSSTTYKPKHIPPMDNRSNLLLRSRNSRSPRKIQHIPNHRPPPQQRQHLHTRLLHLRIRHPSQDVVVQLRKRSERCERFDGTVEFEWGGGC